MNVTLASTLVKAVRPPRWHARLPILAAAALVLAAGSSWDLARTRSLHPGPVPVARFRLEQRQGQFYRPGSTSPFTGWVTDYFPGGALRLRSFVQDGWLQGESEGWFANGRREVLEQFQHGQAHGTRTTWHDNGQKRSEGRLVAGAQHGLYRQWDEQGHLAAEAEFAAGKPHGLSRAWYPSGCLKAEACMNHGEILARHIYPDGIRREPTLLAGNPIP